MDSKRLLEMSSFCRDFKHDKSRGSRSMRLPNRISSVNEGNLDRIGRSGDSSSISANSKFTELVFGYFEYKSFSCSIYIRVFPAQVEFLTEF